MAAAYHSKYGIATMILFLSFRHLYYLPPKIAFLHVVTTILLTILASFPSHRCVGGIGNKSKTFQFSSNAHLYLFSFNECYNRHLNKSEEFCPTRLSPRNLYLVIFRAVAFEFRVMTG